MTTGADHDPLNGIILELYDYANANGSFGPAELRSHAEKVADLVGRARQERAEMLHEMGRLLDAAESNGADRHVIAQLKQSYSDKFDHDSNREREWMKETT